MPPHAVAVFVEALRGVISEPSLVTLITTRLVEGSLRIHYLHNPDPQRRSDAFTQLNADNTIDLALNVAATDFRRAAHHEAHHLVDFLIHGRRLSTALLEQRAIEHTAKMMAPKPAPQPRPRPTPGPEPDYGRLGIDRWRPKR